MYFVLYSQCSSAQLRALAILQYRLSTYDCTLSCRGNLSEIFCIRVCFSNDVLQWNKSVLIIYRDMITVVMIAAKSFVIYNIFDNILKNVNLIPLKPRNG